MKVLLITLDSVRHECVPLWFLEKYNPFVYTNARTYYAGTIPSLTSFLTGVSPVIHGVGSHHEFYKAKMKVSSIFDLMFKAEIPAAFSSDEELMGYMQCVKSAIEVQVDDIRSFLDRHPSCFLCWHIYYPTHAPYNSKEVMKLIQEGRANNYSHWTDDRFLQIAKDAYLKAIEVAFRNIENLLDYVGECKAIISADHGEAFGEEKIWGHEEMFIEEVLRIPFMVIGEGTGSCDEVVYSSKAFELIKGWFEL